MGGGACGKMIKGATSSAPRAPAARRATRVPVRALLGPPLGDVGGVLNVAAEVALKSRLRAWTAVSPSIVANVGDVMQGRVAGVTIRGRGWRSPLGLSCRTLEVAVPRGAGIDVDALFQRQRILLSAPVTGDGVVVLDARDFDAFLSHPRMPSPGRDLAFRAGGARGAPCEVDPKRGVVRFSCASLPDGNVLRCELQGGAGKPVVRVVDAGQGAGVGVADYEGVGERLGRFFADLVFELDGTFLQFRRMEVAPGPSPTITLDVSVRVEKFPSPGVEF